MELQAVRKTAKALGVKAAGLRKLDIVRGIQKAEGNFPCFATAATDGTAASGKTVREKTIKSSQAQDPQSGQAFFLTGVFGPDATVPETQGSLFPHEKRDGSVNRPM